MPDDTARITFMRERALYATEMQKVSFLLLLFKRL